MSIEAELQGLEEIKEMLDSIDEKKFMKAVARAARQELQAIRLEAANNCPKDSGELSQSIKTRSRFEDGQFIGEVYTNKEYAVFVEMGTGPKGEASHEGINPEWEKSVTYSPKPWKRKLKNGREVFVNSNGMAARPFLYPAFKSRQGKLYRAIAREVIREAKKGG